MSGPQFKRGDYDGVNGAHVGIGGDDKRMALDP